MVGSGEVHVPIVLTNFVSFEDNIVDFPFVRDLGYLGGDQESTVSSDVLELFFGEFGVEGVLLDPGDLSELDDLIIEVSSREHRGRESELEPFAFGWIVVGEHCIEGEIYLCQRFCYCLGQPTGLQSLWEDGNRHFGGK